MINNAQFFSEIKSTFWAIEGDFSVSTGSYENRIVTYWNKISRSPIRGIVLREYQGGVFEFELRMQETSLDHRVGQRFCRSIDSGAVLSLGFMLEAEPAVTFIKDELSALIEQYASRPSEKEFDAMLADDEPTSNCARR